MKGVTFRNTRRKSMIIKRRKTLRDTRKKDFIDNG